MVVFPRRGEKEEMVAILDTLVLEPDRGRFILTWRASRPLQRNMFDVALVVAGQMPAGWYRRREPGEGLSLVASILGGCPPRRGRAVSRVEVLATGMVTSVGFTAATTSAAIRSAISGFTDTRFRDYGGEWILGSMVLLIPP